MTELKPCAFCGQPGIIKSVDIKCTSGVIHYWAAGCSDPTHGCIVHIDAMLDISRIAEGYVDREDAVTQWNGRVEKDDCGRVLIDKLVQMLKKETSYERLNTLEIQDLIKRAEGGRP